MSSSMATGVRMADPIYRGTLQTLCILVHCIGVVQNWYAIYYDYTYVHFTHPSQSSSTTNIIDDDDDHHHEMATNNRNFGGKFKFLTFLNAILQAIYFSIALCNDFVGSNRVASSQKLPRIRRLKDYLIASLAFPIALNVAITFWALYAIDRELVFPRILDEIFPSWLNHIMHTNILVFMVLEMFICFRQYPSRRQGFTGLIIFMLCYLIWLHIVRHFSGIWVYPILEVLNLPQRLIFFACSLLLTLILYLLGETLNRFIWRKELILIRSKRM